MFRLILLTLLSNALAKPYQQVETNFCTDKVPGLFSQGCSSNVTICNHHGKEMWLLCPFDLIYDGSIEECKDQKLVADCNSAASDSQSIVPHAQGLPDSLCEGKADGYHSATDCSTSVVQCVGGVSRLLECPKDEVFDNVKQGCTSPDEVVACRAADEPTESTASSSGPKTDCEGLADGFFEKEPCSSFFLTCSGGVSRILTCPANLVFDQKLSMCEYPGNVESCNSQPEEGSGVSSVCSKDGYFSYGNCSDVFYACSNGRQIPMFCPAKLAFDESRQLCDYPLAVAICTEGSGESSGESSGKSSAEAPGGGSEASGETFKEGSSQASRESSGEGSGEAPVEQPRKGSAEGSGASLQGDQTGFLTEPRLQNSASEYARKSDAKHTSSDERAFEGSAEASGEPSGAHEDYSGDGVEASGGLSYEASQTYEASGESSGPTSQDAATNPTQAPQVEAMDEPTTPVPETVRAFCDGKADGFYAPGCSSEVIACRGGEASSMLCPNHMLYDEKKRICEYPENVACYVAANENTVHVTCTTEGPSGNGRCSRTFTNCVEGKAFQLACDEGYVFSEEHRTCAEVSKVKECLQSEPAADAGVPVPQPETTPLPEQPVVDTVAPQTTHVPEQPAPGAGYGAPPVETTSLPEQPAADAVPPQPETTPMPEQPAAHDLYAAPVVETTPLPEQPAADVVAPQPDTTPLPKQPVVAPGYDVPVFETTPLPGRPAADAIPPQPETTPLPEQPAARDLYAAPVVETTPLPEQPAADVVAPQPDTTPLPKQPVVAPGYDVPVFETTPLPGRPAADAIPPQPETTPLPEQPAARDLYAAPVVETTPLPEQPAADVVAQQPDTTPLPKQPIVAPGYAAPVVETTPLPEQPETAPLQEQPAADARYAAPSAETTPPLEQPQPVATPTPQVQHPVSDVGAPVPRQRPTPQMRPIPQVQRPAVGRPITQQPIPQANTAMNPAQSNVGTKPEQY